MATSSVVICNSALVKVGAERINSLSDSNQRARLCNERYDPLRKETLASHPWNFALKRTTPSVDGTAPDWEFTKRYALPSDCLRLLKTNLDYLDDWVVENGYILTDQSDLSLLYIFNQTDTTAFTPVFEEALAFRIAIDLAYNLVKSTTLADSMLKGYDRWIRLARSFDAQEGQSVRRVEANEWYDARW